MTLASKRRELRASLREQIRQPGNDDEEAINQQIDDELNKQLHQDANKTLQIGEWLKLLLISTMIMGAISDRLPV